MPWPDVVRLLCVADTYLQGGHSCDSRDHLCDPCPQRPPDLCDPMTSVNPCDLRDSLCDLRDPLTSVTSCDLCNPPVTPCVLSVPL